MLCQSLLISRGNLEVFVTRPITATILAVALAVLLLPPILRRLRPGLQPVVGEEI